MELSKSTSGGKAQSVKSGLSKGKKRQGLQTYPSQPSRKSSASSSGDDSIKNATPAWTNVDGPPATDAASSKRKDFQWEVIQGLHEGERCLDKPTKFTGFLWMRRKWPLKGWRKRYCVLDSGALQISKNSEEYETQRQRHTIDIGMCVVSTRNKDFRIDVDSEEYIYHFKVKHALTFKEWTSALTRHRLYRQDKISYGGGVWPSPLPAFQVKSVVNGTFDRTQIDGTIVRDLRSVQPSRSISLSPVSREVRVASWLLGTEPGGTSHDQSFHPAKELLIELSSLLQKLEHTDDVQYSRSSSPSLSEFPFKSTVPSHPAPRNRRRRGFFRRTRRKNTNAEVAKACGSLLATQSMCLSVSSPNIAEDPAGDQMADGIDDSGYAAIKPGSTYQQDKLDFIRIARDTESALREIFVSLETEYERLLNRNKSSMDFSDMPVCDEARGLPFPVSVSRSAFSMPSEYHDAYESLSKVSSSSSEADVEESTNSEDYLTESDDQNPDTGAGTTSSETAVALPCILMHRPRETLPAIMPEPGGLSLWGILSRNIGKDLSKVSMPVVVHEPLSALQVLSEELEYSELLDQLSSTEKAEDRIAIVAAFAVSCYASTYYRAERKPFNPLLGETFECCRNDKGFRFIAEQVSHHPPISACHAIGIGWIWWQDQRVKIKFWGRSMEVQPLGSSHLELKEPKEEYIWNKVTTCVHNILSGQRWVDQYGEMVIRCPQSGMKCVLQFEKASHKGQDKNVAVTGVVKDFDGDTIQKLCGKWTEGLYVDDGKLGIGLWKARAMPLEHELYYGFTHWAIQLNELTPVNEPMLPPTDSRFRPDQRMLEEGKIEEAETMKESLERTQRDRRKLRDEMHQSYEPLWFSEVPNIRNEKEWRYNGRYWDMRDRGFSDSKFTPVW